VPFKWSLAGLLVLITMPQDVSAAEDGVRARKVPCVMVRHYVAKYSVSAAESWARSHGATDVEIENARRCLPPAVLQNAQNVQNTPNAQNAQNTLDTTPQN